MIVAVEALPFLAGCCEFGLQIKAEEVVEFVITKAIDGGRLPLSQSVKVLIVKPDLFNLAE